MVNTLSSASRRISSTSRLYGMLQLACHHHYHHPSSNHKREPKTCHCAGTSSLREGAGVLQRLRRRGNGPTAATSAAAKAITKRSIHAAAAASSPSPSQTTTPQGGLEGGLYVTATPIGNLQDLSFRALKVLEECDEVLCEDTRRTIKLLSHYGIKGKRLSSYHEHNKKSHKHREALEMLRVNSFRKIALVCDAGTPTVSDPGSELVKEAREMGVRVHCIPGPCAFAAALSASGITRGNGAPHTCAAGLDVHFVGFLPDKSKHMKRKLLKMRDIEAVHAMYVAPHDLVKQLKCIGQIFGQATTIVLARELTKVYEEFWRGSLEEALAEFTLERQPKGEFTLLVENYNSSNDSDGIGGQNGEEDEDHSAVVAVDGKVEKILRSLIASGTPASEAVRLVCSVSQQPLKKKNVYNAAMKLKDQENPPPV